MRGKRCGAVKTFVKKMKQMRKKSNHSLYPFPLIVCCGLYGSRAKGNYKPGSDVDLTLKGKKLNLKLLNKISLDLDDLLLPYTLDLSIYHHIANPDLIKHIERVGKIFYKRARNSV